MTTTPYPQPMGPQDNSQPSYAPSVPAQGSVPPSAPPQGGMAPSAPPQSGYTGYPQNGAQPGYNSYPQASYAQPTYPGTYSFASAKSRVVAALLAFFIGGLGAHNFYRGQAMRGIGHLALTGLTFLFLIISLVSLASDVDSTGYTAGGPTLMSGFFMLLFYVVLIANSIWAFIEFIMILLSKDGSLR